MAALSGGRCIGLALAAAGLFAPGALAQEGTVQASAVVTVMAKGGAAVPTLTQEDLKVTVNNKPVPVTSFTPLRGDRSGLELIVLIDDSARTRLGEQLPDLRRFVGSLPARTNVGVAYMQNGRAVITQGLTPDHGLAAKSFRLPQGIPGGNASPYFCLSDLAKHWPSNNPEVRREVLMVTDGADAYGGARFDPENPYVLAAIADAQRARMIVHSIFYRDAGDGPVGEFSGQDYLLMVSRATGGRSYYQMSGSPVSFSPYLDELQTRLTNQYELGFLAQSRGRAELQDFKAKATEPHLSIDAPEKVSVGRVEGSTAR